MTKEKKIRKKNKKKNKEKNLDCGEAEYENKA